MTDEDALRCGGGPQPVEPQPEVLARVARTSVSVFRRCCCQCSALATPFYRFLARFSGRRRRTSHWLPLHSSLPPTWFWFCLLVSSTLCSIAEACSSRATPKPRPPAPTPRPNITFHTYTCPPAYAAWYCLNGATCFTVKIENSLLYNCECADGYMGPRCEYKDLDGTYLPSQRRFMMETASIAGGATIAVVLMFIVCVAAYIRVQRRTKNTGGSVTAQTAGAVDCVDGGGGVSPPPGRVFGNPWRNQQPHNTMTVPLGPPPPSLRPVSLHQESPMMQPDVHWTERQTRSIATDDRIRVGAPP